MRRKTVSAIVLSLLLMGMLLLTFSPIARAQKDKITIGVAESLTGREAAACALFDVYYGMIVDDYNAKGGIYVPQYGKRLPIELKVYDDQSDIPTCLTLIEKLITQDKVDLLFPTFIIEFNVAAFPLYEKYKMPVVALAVGSDIASARMKSGEIKYCFVTLGQPYEDAIEVTDMLTYINSSIASDTTRVRSVGIIYRSDQYGVEHSAAISKELTARGFQVPVLEAYPEDIADFTPLINTLRSADVDVAMICGYGEGALFIKKCEALDYNPKLIFIGPTMEEPLLVYAVFGFTPGEMAGIAYYDGFPSTAYNTAETAAWAEMHRSRLGYLPFPGAATFYASLDCLWKAVELVGLDREKIRDALATVTWNDTLVGKLRFRPGQSPEVEVAGTLTQWQGGEMMDVVWPLKANSSGHIIYPMFPWSWAKVADVNRDGKVDILDIAAAAKAFGSSRGDPRYSFVADVNGDGNVDIIDIAMIARDFWKKVFP